MEKVIQKFCNNKKDHGLLLLEMPTGSGKTHQALDYIYHASMDEANKDKKYIFITTLKKNLPEEELRQRFKNGGVEKQFDDKYLFLDSNVDCVLNNLPDLEVKIPDEINELDEYRELEDNVNLYWSIKGDERGQQSKKQNTSIDMKRMAERIKEKLRTEIEPRFRYAIQNLLSEKAKTQKERVSLVQSNEEWSWLSELYPAVLTSTKQIIFMSVDKFLSKNSTLVESSYFMYNSDFIDGAVIFIDEFDATKETVLNKIIDDSIRTKVDYIRLFNKIYEALSMHKPMKELTEPSKGFEKQFLESIIDNFKKMALEIHDKYSLEFNYKTDDNFKDTNRPLLYHDHAFHTVLDADNSFITVRNDTINSVNRISLADNKKANDTSYIQAMLGEIEGFITYFSNGVKILADNYLRRKQETINGGEDDFTYENAIHSILNEFVPEEYVDFLTTDIMLESRKRKDKKENGYDLSFYESGFRYYTFEDDPNHDMQSKIMMCSFQKTPEKILLSVCERAKVIGISATATLPSVIGNYDIDYLKMKLGDSFMAISKEDEERMELNFENAQKGYENVNINVEFLGEQIERNYSKDSWKLIFDNDTLADEVSNYIDTKVGSDSDNGKYDKVRYARIALAYKKYLLEDDIQSFLCILTKFPRPGDKDLDLAVLRELFEILRSELGKENMFDYDDIYLLDSEDFVLKKSEVGNMLTEGKKMFVISTYKTIGAGQNLQYTIPEGMEADLKRINDFGGRKEKDFDAIYLDKPTNLIGNLSGEKFDARDLACFIFDVEYLQNTGEVSKNDTYEYVKCAFKRWQGQKVFPKTKKKLSSTRSVKLLATRTVIQAIGRICRTNMKNPNIHIYADSRIADYIDISTLNTRMLNKEFKALIDKLQIKNEQDQEEATLCNRANLGNERANRYINGILRNRWTDKSMREWKELREFSLKNPTLSLSLFMENSIAHNFYAQLVSKGNELVYSAEDDYGHVNIGFSDRGGKPYSVSEEHSKLDQIMRISYLRNYFEESGYATKFEPDDCIMLPVMFKNIYMGALGETVGKVTFDRNGISLDEIQDSNVFELFDFKVSGKDVYIDFKNWNGSAENDAEIFKKIEKKANQIENCKRVLIVNILSPKSDYFPYTRTLEGVKVMVVPYLYLESKDGKEPQFNYDTWMKIKEFINGKD